MNVTLSISTLLAIPLAPLLGAVVAAISAIFFPPKNKFAQNVSRVGAIAGILVAFLLSILVLNRVLMDGWRLNETIYEWMEVGGLKMEIGFLIDGLSSIMMVVITFVSLMVHIYTIGYMKNDIGYNRFFSYISLFTFSMLMLVMSNNLLQLFFGWEAVGLVSYLLIGFWFNKPSAIFANMKAFLVNRIGDFGFIIGIGLIFSHLGTLNYIDIFSKKELFETVNIFGPDYLLITVICICLFIGAMGKSAQFPLHIWLPDSMEGPTPISALIHAATMVTAGIFMVSRMSPLFEMSETALNFIMLIGSITALFMGFLGVVQNDIKRVIAYSTLSQLGYMTVALGASAYSVSFFHLMTHAFFKALLFLAAGSVIIGMHHNQDIRWMGGLKKYMPITWLTYLIGTLALIGTPFFSGFYSKDSIIEAVKLSHLPVSGFAYTALLFGVFVTALYSFRVYFLVFHGSERYNENPDAHHFHNERPHESPWVITSPLILLSIPSVLIGYFSINEILFGQTLKSAIFVDTVNHISMPQFEKVFQGPLEMVAHAFFTPPLYLALAGFISAWYMYMINKNLPNWFAKNFNGIKTFMDNKYYIDYINENLICKSTRNLGKFFWIGGDKIAIESGVVNASWHSVDRASLWLQKMQTGYLYFYILVMSFAVLSLMTYFLWIAK